jgi:uncharacterized membrane protein (Fun14 family)
MATQPRDWQLMRRSKSAVRSKIVALVTGCALLSAFAPLTAGAVTVDTRPTLTQLATLIQQSSTVNQLPAEAKAMMANVASKYSGFYVGLPKSRSTLCDAKTGQSTIPANPGTTCLFGQPTAKRTLVLFGDSQANMWVPAFHELGILLNLRVVAFSKPSCPPWGYVVTQTSGAAYPDCTLWRTAVRKYINDSHPAYVVLTGASGFISATHYPSAQELATGVKATTDLLKASKSKVILLSNIPWLRSTGTGADTNSCMSANPTSISNCFASRTSDALVNDVSAGLWQASSTQHLPIVDVSNLFCSTTTCVSVVGKQLVYSDRFHALAAYMTYISRALVPLISPKLT